MRSYIRRFFCDKEDGESGAELLEIAIGFALTALIIGILAVIIIVVKNKTVDAGEQIDRAGNNGNTTVDWDNYRDNDSAVVSVAGGD